MDSNANFLTWVDSTGGFLILLAEDLLHCWAGADALGTSVATELQNSSESLTDYDRACSIDNFLGIIDVNGGQALVVGDEPLSTTWVSIGSLSGILVGLRFSETQQNIIHILNCLDVKSTGEILQMTEFFVSGPLFLFDSSIPGLEVKTKSEGLSIHLPRGLYKIETFRFDPDCKTSLLCHQFSHESLLQISGDRVRPANSGKIL